MSLPTPATRRAFRLALAASLLIHAGLLLIPLSQPRPAPLAGGSRLAATLPVPLQVVPSRRRPPVQEQRQVLTAAKGSSKARHTAKSTPRQTASSTPRWSQAEKDDMNKFLDGLASEARPRSGRELANNALAAARDLGRHQARAEEEEDQGRASNARPAERFSLEMYFDALVKKLNKSAGFVKNDPRSKGVKAAAVQVQLNADGSLKSFRILNAADQQEEIAFIKSVVERAVPFAAFPADIKQGSGGSLSILICILPTSLGDGGFGFSRTSTGRDCR